MSATLMLSSLRRRKSPLYGAFFTPSDLSDLALIQTIANIAADLVSGYRDPKSSSPFFQRRNTRSLIWKVEILHDFLKFLCDEESLSKLPSSAMTCIKEVYILIHRARILHEFCIQSSRLWLLLRIPQVSGHFHDLNMEIANILDVFPFGEIDLVQDVREQIELLHRHCRRSKIFVEPREEAIRLRIFSFLEEFDEGKVPDSSELREAFVNCLGFRDAKICRAEIEFLEEQIYSQEDDLSPSLLGGVIALIRFCRFRLFESIEEETKRNPSLLRVGESSVTIPKDFCCPISLDLMRDPVITSSGQTYDRTSITQWIEEGHCTCPNSGQMLSHTRLMPNRALRNLISQFCASNAIPYDALDGYELLAETAASASACRATSFANQKTAEILLKMLSAGSESEKTIAALEIRLLAKTGKKNRASIAELGAIPLLQKLLESTNPNTQENSVTAILNLSILETNKMRIMELNGCLSSIVSVLINGLSTEARENAAATLFSLSAVHSCKKRITDECGAVEALALLLKEGTPRGKKDAVTALFNLSTHPDSSTRMVESGAVSALVEALTTEGVAEEAAGAIALLVRQQTVAEVVGKDDTTVMSLVGLIRRGSAKGKENAVAALHELCRSGGLALTQKVARTPALGGLIQTILFTGTKRARRKAASLVKLCQRSEIMAATAVPLGGGWEYSITTRNSSMRRSSVFVAGDVSVSVSLGISVPVL